MIVHIFCINVEAHPSELLLHLNRVLRQESSQLQQGVIIHLGWKDGFVQQTGSRSNMQALAILRPTSMWGTWFGVPYRNFFDTVKAGLYFHIGHRSCTKTYGYIENAVYQIHQILSTPTTDKNNKVFYLGDQPAIFIEEWANQIAAALGRKVPRVPFWLIRIAAWTGDLLKLVGIHFPMTSFRLKNMTTDNIIPLDNTIAIAPHPPVDRLTGIQRTLEWMETSK